MILLDTDIFSLQVGGHARVNARVQSAPDVVAISIITWIEVLQGRFDAVLKAADAKELQLAQQRLQRSDKDLSSVTIISINVTAAAEFDRLVDNKKLKKIGRADLLIAAVALAHRATLVTRNLRHFRQVLGLQLENWAD